LTFAAIGNARESGRAVFVAESHRIEELPALISIPCRRFVLLLAYDHGGVPARLTAALGELLDRGCVYLCAWGPGCRHVEDTMDDVSLERDLESGVDQTIMTTSHHGVRLEEAVDFALQYALPDDALAQGCDAIVLAAVDNSEWADVLRNAAQQYLLPSVL
jgi:hypothetical protein